jgi:hypothetical protein
VQVCAGAGVGAGVGTRVAAARGLGVCDGESKWCVRWREAVKASSPASPAAVHRSLLRAGAYSTGIPRS